MSVVTILLYVSLFVSLFFEVFLLITYLEIREEIKFEKGHDKPLDHYPTVTIIVPCFNEESTVSATINSLLALEYPKAALRLMVVDDGSTDGTQKALKEFKNNPQVEIYKKENGGKHTALNFALERIESEFVGCLDADSFVDAGALTKIMGYFGDVSIMAVTPAVRIHEPKTILQHVQRVEYTWGVLWRRILASIDGLYVTPGPFSIFRTTVFRKLGGYREAHHTEDMEMALRMQKHGFRIANSPGSYVYTVGPKKLGELYRQRVRWTYGFLNNAIDYRSMFFNKKYGNVGMFVLPVATLTVFTTLYAASQAVWHLLTKIYEAFIKYQAIGFQTPHLPQISLSSFTLNTGLASVLTYVTIILTLTILSLALAMADGKVRLSKGVVYYLSLYIFIVPLWLAKATYSTLARKSITWR